jgi:hypothetical protein
LGGKSVCDWIYPRFNPICVRVKNQYCSFRSPTFRRAESRES